MLFGLLKSDRERAAEHDAAMLLAHYGAEAEDFCLAALSGRQRPDAGQSIQMIRSALKQKNVRQIGANA